MSHQQQSAEARVEQTKRFQLSVPQILAGALAAASAAVAASWLGVAGTVLGAVVASVVVSVSSALYAHPIERSSQVIKESLPVLPVLPDRFRERETTITETRRLSADPDEVAGLPTIVSSTRLADELVEVPEVPEVATAAGLVTTGPRLPARRIRWSTVAVSSALTLVVGFGLLTAFEAVIGKPASSLTGGNGGGTTLSRFVDDSSQDGPAKPGSDGDGDQPTQPTEPTGPTSPTEPTEPTSPTEPTEPTSPTEPTQPTQPTQPTAPETTAPPVDDRGAAQAPEATVATSTA